MCLKIVKNDYIYEVASLKSSTLLDKLEALHSFFQRSLSRKLPRLNSGARGEHLTSQLS